MNRTDHSGPKRVLAIVVVCVFWVTTGMPLYASPPQSAQSNTADHSAGNSLPEAPEPQATQTTQQPTQAPSGAAGAKTAPVHGAPAAQPVGAAVAPAKQHGHRSLLIKAGLLAGAGIAIGTVIALSARSPNRPPGAPSSTHP